MENGIIVGNLISLIAAVFTAKSSLAKDTRSIYMNQVYQCAILAIASVYFKSYAGIVTLAFCALRNYYAAIGKLTGFKMIVCAGFIVFLGAVTNNRGIIGWIVIAANILYSVGIYFAKTEMIIKCNIILNLTLWIVYECFIMDFPSIIADGIGLIAAVIAVFKLVKSAGNN